MNDKTREEFEKAYPLTSGVHWNEKMSSYKPFYPSDFFSATVFEERYKAWKQAKKRYAPKWISVSEQKPKTLVCMDVLGRISSGYHEGDKSRFTDVFYENGEYWFWNHDMEKEYLVNFTVTNWMPLPEEPEANNE